jgi:hypothetical protein
MHAPAFRDDVPNKLVTLLKAALLVGLVRITEKNTCPAFSVLGDLNGPGILEFRTVLSEDHSESSFEDSRSEQIIELVENIFDGFLSA